MERKQYLTIGFSKSDKEIVDKHMYASFLKITSSTRENKNLYS